MNQLPGHQSAAPVAHKDEQEEGADERKPIAIGLLADLLAGHVADVVPEELQKVLDTTGIALHLARAHHDKGEQGSDHNPGAQKHLAVNLEIPQLPIEVLTHLQFGKGKNEWQGTHRVDVRGRKCDVEKVFGAQRSVSA